MKKLGLILCCYLLSNLAFADHNSCQFSLINQGQQIGQFDASNCSDAQYQCEQERDYQVRAGYAQNAFCQMSSSNGNGQYNGGGYGQNQTQSCMVSLQDAYGVNYQTFYGYDCRQALQSCNRERVLRQTPYQTLRCDIINNGPQYPDPYPYPGNQMSCNFQLKDSYNGQIVSNHVMTGRTEQHACELSYNSCQVAARNRNGYGMQRYVCQKAYTQYPNPYPGQYQVTQSCTYRVVSINEATLDNVTASATAIGEQQAKQQACSNAQVQCHSVIQQRTIPGRPSPYSGARCEYSY